MDKMAGRIYTVDTMKTRVQRWGNSLAVRLPKHVADAAGLAEHCDVEVELTDDGVTIKKVTSDLRLDAVVAQITPENRHGAIEWDGPRGREVW
jgi:antitoxin MazE